MTEHVIKVGWREAAKLPNIRRTDDDLFVEIPRWMEDKVIPGDLVELHINDIPSGYRIHVSGHDGEIVQRYEGNLVIQFPVVPPRDECPY